MKDNTVRQARLKTRDFLPNPTGHLQELLRRMYSTATKRRATRSKVPPREKWRNALGRVRGEAGLNMVPGLGASWRRRQSARTDVSPERNG